MTLNITVLTPETIYQSADYLLFDTSMGRSLPMPSTKVVVLSYFDWTGFITYTGIGRVGSQHTSQTVEGWLKNLNRPTFEEIAEVIRSRASSWVASVKPGERHTFVMAAYVGGLPTAAVVSNFQKWQGAESNTVERVFETSTIVAQRRPEVIVTGMRQAVPREQRRRLQRLVQDAVSDGARVRRAMADTNREGAKRFPSHISEDCFVYSQDSFGRGHYEAMGQTRTDLIPGVGAAGGGSAIRDLLDKQFGPGKWTLKGMTSGTSAKQSPPPERCKPTLCAMHSSEAYTLVELTNPEGRRATPRAVSRTGIVVGQGCPHWNGPSFPCYWPERSTIEFLAHGGGLGGNAIDINESGLITGASEWPDRASHACVWMPDGTVQDIGGKLGRHSQANVLNDAGTVAGWVSIHATEGGQAHYRPACWPTAGAPTVLEHLGGWGEAVDLNAEGDTLIRVHKAQGIMPSGEAEAWVWRHDGQTSIIGKPGLDTQSFYPKRISEDRQVVGLAIQRNGERHGLLVQPDGSWKPLFPHQPDRELTAVSRGLKLVGRDSIDRYNIPWTKEDQDEIRYLPHYRYHHHQVTMVSDAGWIVGTASGDNCCHPIIWVPV